MNIQYNYYQFGIELGLRFRDMGAIKKAFQLDVPQAFTEVLGIWLRHSYDVKRYGPPTWRRLVEAVDSPAGGNNHALAKTIAEHHPVKKVDSRNNNTPIAEQHSSAPAEISASDHESAVAKTIAGYHPIKVVNSSANVDASAQEIGEPHLSAPAENPATESTHAVAEIIAKHHPKGS